RVQQQLVVGRLQLLGLAVQCEAHAAATFSGVNGRCVSLAAVASRMAFDSAGAMARMPVSPMPTAPYGPVGCGTSTITGTNSIGTSSIDGSWYSSRVAF